MSSPSRKRQRLSSPTYEDSLELPDEEELEELYRIEISLSQQEAQASTPLFQNSAPPPISQFHGQDFRQKRIQPIRLSAQDREKIYGNTLLIQNTSSQAPSDVDESFDLLGSPDIPSDKHNSNWFAPSSTPTAGFQLASRSLLESSTSDDLDVADDSFCFGFTSSKLLSQADGSGVGFTSASGSRSLAIELSKEALELAAKKMKDWSEEDDELLKAESNAQSTEPPKSPPKPVSTDQSFRPVLAPVGNTPKPFQTPKPISAGIKRPFSSPLLSRSVGPSNGKANGFKSPLISNASPRTVYYPRGSTEQEQGAKSPSRQISTPSRLNSGNNSPFRTPMKAGPSNQSRAKPAFVTPFKQGMKPGEPGRLALEQRRREQIIRAEETVNPYPPCQSKYNPVLMEKKMRERMRKKIPLRESGLYPRRYTTNDFERMNINIANLSQITPQTAKFYSFDMDNNPEYLSVLGPGVTKFGPTEACDYLSRTGRDASPNWIDNHWGLILWKLAGLVALDPEQECRAPNPDHLDDTENKIFKRWHWRTVVKQLEFRYDIEYDGKRPAFRMITTGDAPAGSPLVLVVTQILSKGDPSKGTGEGSPAVIEVSDGWYFLKATLDAPLTRAVTRGKIRPGCKLATAGAKLENTKKDPCDILEAYNACSLKLYGNGTHLSRWDTKLGYQMDPFIATLGSLTLDGGIVPLMDLVVEKIYPIAYLEYINQPGSSFPIREGPRSEKEEAEVDDIWRKRREREASKIQDKYEARWARYEALADRAEHTISADFIPQIEDQAPGILQDILDSIDETPDAESQALQFATSNTNRAYIMRYMRDRIRRERQSVSDDIEAELDGICPPREVRNFRIVQVRDAQTARRPANRVAQVTVWDVLSLCVSEGGRAGSIEVGQRFLLTNLIPAQKSAWMGNAKDDIIYLSTRQNSRFIRLR